MIQRAKITHGDFRAWSTTILHEQLEKVINSKQHRRRPYYILVIIKRGYFGPPAFHNANNMLSGDRVTAEKTKDMNFENDIVFSCRLILMDCPPIVRLIGSALWYVDNVCGIVKNVYILPPDMPVDSTKDMTEESELVAKSGKDMPLAFNRRK